VVNEDGSKLLDAVVIPTALSAPIAVSGTSTVGQTLTATVSDPSGAMVSYQWYGGGTAVSGKLKVGKTLIARVKAWGPAPVTLTYQWYANGKAIKHATKARLKLTKTLAHKRISVRVTGAEPGYTTLTKASKRTKKLKI
jgi:hypothetical protein